MHKWLNEPNLTCNLHLQGKLFNLEIRGVCYTFSSLRIENYQAESRSNFLKIIKKNLHWAGKAKPKRVFGVRSRIVRSKKL